MFQERPRPFAKLRLPPDLLKNVSVEIFDPDALHWAVAAGGARLVICTSASSHLPQPDDFIPDLATLLLIHVRRDVRYCRCIIKPFDPVPSLALLHVNGFNSAIRQRFVTAATQELIIFDPSPPRVLITTKASPY